MGDGKYPIYILGPCAAESREQVLETAKQICDLRFNTSDFRFVFRAGAWKPRTSPYSFKGAGEEGLKWLQEVKATFGVPVATEVALPDHVRLAIEAGMDYLWLGARTSANPIAVEAMAEAIDRYTGGSTAAPKAILIKNPVNADAQLWLGNIERLEKTGVPVIAVHRGCGHKPCWNMAHTIRLARPDIPMLLDPSHMSGDAAQVPALLEKVAELDLDGAMIEVHCHPEAALSDNAQQLTPTRLRDALDPLLSRLCLASLICPSDDQKELNWFRAEIDELDDRLWGTIAARMEVSRRIGEWKKAHGVAPLQPERYQQIVERLRGTNYGLPEDFILKIWELIHEQSLRVQEV